MEELTANIARHGVFFLLLGDTEKISYNHRMYHQSMCLAQGLRELGLNLTANVDAFGISKAPPSSQALWLVDISELSFDLLGQKETIAQLQALPGQRKIFFYGGDNGSKFYFPDDMPLLLVSENEFLELPGQRIPWAYGLPQNLMAMPTNSSRKEAFLANFRPSFNQSLRQALDLSFVSLLAKEFEVDKNLTSSSEYFARLSNCLGCLSYGGTFEQDLTLNPNFANNPFYIHPDGAYVSPLNFKFHKETVILRWDSWRIWEAFACGALVIQPNMEKYGFLWPETPQDRVHYVGIDLEKPQECVEYLRDNRDKLFQIAQAGQAWARENYSPQAVARRFLNLSPNY